MIPVPLPTILNWQMVIRRTPKLYRWLSGGFEINRSCCFNPEATHFEPGLGILTKKTSPKRKRSRHTRYKPCFEFARTGKCSRNPCGYKHVRACHAFQKGKCTAKKRRYAHVKIRESSPTAPAQQEKVKDKEKKQELMREDALLYNMDSSTP